MKKKYAVTFLVTPFLVLAISLTTSVLAQPTPNADSLGVEDASGRPGTYVEVPVSIINIKNGPVQSIRLRVDYNESVLNPMNIRGGDLTSAWTHLQLGEDRHTMVIATAHSEDTIPDESNGSVVLLNFSVIGSPGDSSPMNMTLIELSNPEGEVGTTPAKNGTFTITPAIDNAPPVITITFPIDGSTLGILNNSVIGCITSERELTVAKLTLNDDFVTTLNKGCFNVKVNYRANETNEIEVFARDKAGNANTSQVLVNVLPNIVVVNKTAIANRTIEITEAKNATNTAIELNATKAANVSVTINANTNASALNATPATSAYGLAQNQHSLEKYIDVNVTGIDRANLSFVSLYLYYTIADLDRNGDGDADDLGDLNETTLKMYWFNPNTSLWMPLGPGADVDGKPDYTVLGGPKVIDSERNKTEKYVKVTLNHFSTFALVAEKIPAPVTPTPTPLPKGGGGVGGTFLPAPSPTSTLIPTLIPAEAPTLAPTVTSSVPPTQTSAPAIPTSPVPFSQIKWLIMIVAIAIVASAIIVSAVYYHYHR